MKKTIQKRVLLSVEEKVDVCDLAKENSKDLEHGKIQGIRNQAIF